MMARSTNAKRFVVCIKNRGYRASLIVRKIYACVTDREAETRQLLRIVDESGEDYLFPAAFFIAVELPQPVQRALAKAS